ncbi:hypothetical protein niasHT_013737 [Heterodera trifolii]|uniref:Uncharacterized protein n=1 Tax=Heterodera trifolii TaxID=157864 RepID=A0ABD2LBX5_9BILA
MLQNVCVLSLANKDSVRSARRAQSSASLALGWPRFSRASTWPPLLLLLYNFLGSFVVRAASTGAQCAAPPIASAGRPILRPSARARRSLLLCAVCVWRGVAAVCLMGGNAGGGEGKANKRRRWKEGWGWRREEKSRKNWEYEDRTKFGTRGSRGGGGRGKGGRPRRLAEVAVGGRGGSWNEQAKRLVAAPLAQQQHREFRDQIFDREKIWGGGGSRTGINGTEGKWLIKVQKVGQGKGGAIKWTESGL